MTDFKNTSNWEKKTSSTILYRYEYEGKQREGELEKEPHTLHVQAERLTVMDTTAWTVVDKKEPDSKTGFQSREFIKVEGKLDLARVHVFTLDETPTATFDRIEVSIYPISLAMLQQSSSYEKWSLREKKERPEEGWLKDEHGRIDYYEATEYFCKELISARLWLDQATFDSVVQKIKGGGTIRNARLEILADLFQFGYEGWVAGPMTTSNYGLLCESDERRTKGYTKARLEELLLEWSPKLVRPQPEVDDLPTEPADDDADGRAVSGLASDVKRIRARMDIFYQAAIAIAVFFVVSNVVGWFNR